MPHAAMSTHTGYPSAGAALSAAHSALSGPCAACGPLPGPPAWPGGLRRSWPAVPAVVAVAGVAGGVRGYLVISDQVAACPFGHLVFGCGDQERAGLGQRVRVPPRRD